MEGWMNGCMWVSVSALVFDWGRWVRSESTQKSTDWNVCISTWVMNPNIVHENVWRFGISGDGDRPAVLSSFFSMYVLLTNSCGWKCREVRGWSGKSRWNRGMKYFEFSRVCFRVSVLDGNISGVYLGVNNEVNFF